MGNSKSIEPPSSVASAKDTDYGRLAGNFLFFLAGLSIAAMFLSPIFLDSFQLDLSPALNIWAGCWLRKKSNRARLFVIAIYSFCVVLLLVAFAIPLLGFNNDVKIAGASVPKEPLVLVPLALASIFLLLYPVVLLVSKPAREQFTRHQRNMLEPRNADFEE